MPDVHVPLLGNIPRKGLIFGVGGGALVVGYLLYKKHQESAAAGASATGYGYGASSYGYGTGVPGYYGYGTGTQAEFAYGYGGVSGAPVPVGGGGGIPIPVGGNPVGYGYGISVPPLQPTPTPTKSTKPGTSVITAQGNMDLYRIARLEGISLGKLLRLNPHLKKYEGTGKHIPKGIKVRV